MKAVVGAAGGWATTSEVWRLGTLERGTRGAPLRLCASVNGAVGGNRFSTYVKHGDTAGYQVATGKTFIITGLLFRVDTAAIVFVLGYGDTDVAFDSAAEPTNTKSFRGGTTHNMSPWAAQTAQTLYAFDVYYEVPAGKFPCLIVPATTAIVFSELLGVEV